MTHGPPGRAAPAGARRTPRRPVTSLSPALNHRLDRVLPVLQAGWFEALVRPTAALPAAPRPPRLRPLGPARGPASPGPVRSRLATLDAVIDVAGHLDHAGMTAAEALLASGLVGRPQAAPGASEAGTSGAAGVLSDQLASIRQDL